jgi:hypothetical protein
VINSYLFAISHHNYLITSQNQFNLQCSPYHSRPRAWGIAFLFANH